MISFEFNFWENVFALLSLLVSTVVAIWIYKLSEQLSAKDKYEHEIRITKEMEKIKIYSSVILADVTKYNPLRVATTNNSYYKQGAEIYTIIPEYGIQFILMPSDKKIPVGLVPFEWIDYIRDYDSEDNKSIIVCKFKGIKLFKNYKSPFKEINYVYENKNYKEGSDPKFLKFTSIKPNHN